MSEVIKQFLTENNLNVLQNIFQRQNKVPFHVNPEFITFLYP